MRLILTTVMCLAAVPAAAQMACTFEAECFEQDGCMSSGFALDVVPDNDNGLVLETEFGNIDVVHAMRAPGSLTALGDGQGARYLLSSTPEGARLSVHMSGPISVTYIGQCEGGV